MNEIMEMLKGGDRRSIGKVEQVVAAVLERPELFGEVFHSMFDSDPVVKMRAADAVEKVSRVRPGLLKPYIKILVDEASYVSQQEVQWHLAQIFSRIELDHEDRRKITDVLFYWLEESRSKIVKVNSMQTLADFAEKDVLIRPGVIYMLKGAIDSDSAAVVSRAKKLLKKFK